MALTELEPVEAGQLSKVPHQAGDALWLQKVLRCRIPITSFDGVRTPVDNV